ncbi:hypothetical protein R3P38DRAFT_3246063 [Favolaschia claudopus]|uniref:Uncharacterized protein n=1 Tax=Favolaschia claudopus TaxID=2862362 RepID=A0AAV9YZK7_9AGAR
MAMSRRWACDELESNWRPEAVDIEISAGEWGLLCKEISKSARIQTESSTKPRTQALCASRSRFDALLQAREASITFDLDTRPFLTHSSKQTRNKTAQLASITSAYDDSPYLPAPHLVIRVRRGERYPKDPAQQRSADLVVFSMLELCSSSEGTPPAHSPASPDDTRRLSPAPPPFPHSHAASASALRHSPTRWCGHIRHLRQNLAMASINNAGVLLH